MSRLLNQVVCVCAWLHPILIPPPTDIDVDGYFHSLEDSDTDYNDLDSD